MSEGSKNALSALISVALVLLIGGSIGYQLGHSAGMEQSRELQKKSECQIEYSNSTFNEVPVRCYEYLNINVEQKVN